MSLFSPRPTLILIDGSSYLYRAYHAVPGLTNKRGEPTGALRGILSMLRSTLSQMPTHAVFVLDAPGPTFRDCVYPDYKGTRKPMPSDMVPQIEPMMQMVQALGFHLLRVEGVEADDVIGTLASHAGSIGLETIISTGDKDFAQLVKPGISLVNTMTQIKLDSEKVFLKYGVFPRQIVDYLALVGDKIDNVPGVRGCGPKTAAQLLSKYESIENILDKIDSISGHIGLKIKNEQVQLLNSRELVMIKTDVHLPVDVQDLKLRPQDHNTLNAFYRRYDFQRK